MEICTNDKRFENADNIVDLIDEFVYYI